VLRSSLELARRRGLIATVPEIDWPPLPKSDFDFLDFDEAERLLAAAREEWWTMILVALRTGLRHGELLALRWVDIDLNRGKLQVRRTVAKGVVGTPKNGREREVPLSSETVAALKAYRHLRGELVFPRMDGRIQHPSNCTKPLWRTCERAGLRRIGWHVLRHSFSSHLVMRGVPLRTVQELLGHASMEMTMRYAHLSPNVVRDAVELLDSRSCIRNASGGAESA
jgi:integrase